MKCDFKTMVKAFFIAAVVVSAAYFALPVMRPFIISVGPYLLFLLCPLSMLFMMKAMSASQGSEKAARADGDERST